MPRDGSGVYATPPGTDGVAGQTIESLKYNANVHDVEQDLNTPRPIVAGGTGATNAHDAMLAMGGELAKQVIANYDSDTFVSGSFYSAVGATSAPNATNRFAGIYYGNADDTYATIEARDQTTGNLYLRTKTAGVWGAWTRDAIAPPVAPTDPANKAYVDAGDAAANAAAAAANAAAAAAQGTANTANSAAATAQGAANAAQGTANAGYNLADAANTNANNRVLRSGDTMTGNLSAPNFIATSALYVRTDGSPTVNFQDANGTFRSVVGYNRAANAVEMFGPATTSISLPADGKAKVSNGIQSKAGFSGGYGTVCYNLNWDGGAGKFHLYADDIHLGVVPLMTDVTALEDKLKAALARIEALERQLVSA
jgi:hypothetical protein